MATFGAGELDRRIDLYVQSESQSTSGAPEEKFAFRDSVWAKYKPVKGQEQIQADQFSGDSWVTFIIRYRADIGVCDRVKFDGNFYDIEETSMLGTRKEFLVITGRTRKLS